jgi:hypothetical protein
MTKKYLIFFYINDFLAHFKEKSVKKRKKIVKLTI